MSKFTKESFKPEDLSFVDLGLPSGRLWATENAPGHYSYDEAIEVFGEFLPKGSAMVELIEECKVEWNEEKEGLDITGPNGNKLFLPAAGLISPGSPQVRYKSEGFYWTRMLYNKLAPTSQTYARGLLFSSGNVGPLGIGSRSDGFSVRPCREF